LRSRVEGLETLVHAQTHVGMFTNIVQNCSIYSTCTKSGKLLAADQVGLKLWCFWLLFGKCRVWLSAG